MRKLIVALFVALVAVPAAADVVVAAMGNGKSSEWLVTNAAGGSTLANLAGRRAILLQNLGPNAIYCTFDGQNPLATGALGYKLDPGGTLSAAAYSTVTVKCIAATAAQVTTAATQVVELQ